MDYERPVVRCVVSYPILGAEPDPWSEPAIVSLETAAELSARGYVVIVDYQDQRDLAMWERLQNASKPRKKWFEQ